MTSVLGQESGRNWTVMNGDCVEIIKGLPDSSMGMCLYSPPFSSLYIYSDSVSDMGNSADHEEFARHYSFLAGELLRVTKPGRLAVVHCKDLPLYKNRDGAMGLFQFPDVLLKCHLDAGWTFHSRVTIWKDPVVEMQRTKNHGLLYKELCKDSCGSRQGMADYLLVFRNWGGEFADPVTSGEERFDSYVGLDPPDPTAIADEFSFMRPVADKWGRWPKRNPFPPGSEAFRIWSIKVWQKYASPVWFDIEMMRTLNEKAAKESGDQKHICLARDSLVLTKERGYVPIQDVRVGEHTLTHRGRWRPVLVVENTGRRPAITIKGQGVSGLTLTPDHKVWCRKSDWVRQRDGAEQVEPAWREAGDTLGGYLNFKLPPIEQPAITDELHWWIVGRWLADGHWDANNSLYISCGDHEIDVLRAKLGDVGGAGFHTGTAYQIRLRDSGGMLRDTIRRCGHGAAGKHFPPEACTLPDEQARALLEGYMSRDRHFLPDRQRWMASSVSRALALGVAMLAQRVHGAISSVYAGRSARTSKIQGRVVRCRQDWIISFDLPRASRYKQPFVLSDGAWKKVRSIYNAGEVETWNLRVEEDESYTAEGCVVKNCPLQLDVIERAVHLWTNPGDVVFTPFAGIGSELMGAVKIGRRAVGIELKESYMKQACKYLRILENDMERPTFFDEVAE